MRIKDISGGVYSLTPTRLVEIRKNVLGVERKHRFVKRTELKKVIKQYGGFVPGFMFGYSRQKIGMWPVSLEFDEVEIGCKAFLGSNAKKIKKWALK
jgi:hypothetical protein